MGIRPVLGYAVIVGVLLAWQGVGLLRPHDDWPTLSDLARSAMRAWPGRWVVFGVWLWVGWHLFARGWEFPLRGDPR